MYRRLEAQAKTHPGETTQRSSFEDNEMPSFLELLLIYYGDDGIASHNITLVMTLMPVYSQCTAHHYVPL